MKFIDSRTKIFFLLIFVAASLHAQLVVSNLDQPTYGYFGPIGSDNNSNDFLIGQEFTLPPSATPYQLLDVGLLLSAAGGGANITVSIYGVGNYINSPSNQLAVVASRFVANAGSVYFTPTNNIMLVPGAYYLVTSPTTPLDSGYVSWAYASTTNWTGAGTLANTADTSQGVWLSYSITNLPQQVSVLVRPVPASIGLAFNGNNSRIFWPTNLNGFVPEGTTNPASTNWLTITNPPIITGGTNFLTFTVTNTAQFYRLRQSLVAGNLDQPFINWDGPIGTNDNSSGFLIGQQFTLPAGNYLLKNVTLPLICTNGSAHITTGIWTVGPDNNPSTQIAIVSTQSVNGSQTVSFTPTNQITLSGGSYYVIPQPATSSDNARVGWYWTESPSYTGFGAFGDFSATYFGAWQYSPFSDGPYEMSVQVTPAGH